MFLVIVKPEKKAHLFQCNYIILLGDSVSRFSLPPVQANFRLRKLHLKGISKVSVFYVFPSSVLILLHHSVWHVGLLN